MRRWAESCECAAAQEFREPGGRSLFGVVFDCAVGETLGSPTTAEGDRGVGCFSLCLRIEGGAGKVGMEVEVEVGA